MSDYYHRSKIDGQDCPSCDSGTVTGNRNSVSCDNCSFTY